MWINLLLLSIFILSPKLLAQSAADESDDYITKNHKVAPIPDGIISEPCDFIENVDTNGSFEVRISHSALSKIDSNCSGTIAKLDAKLKKELSNPDSFTAHYIKKVTVKGLEEVSLSEKFINDLSFLDAWGKTLTTKYKNVSTFSVYGHASLDSNKFATAVPDKVRILFIRPDVKNIQAVDLKEGQQSFFKYNPSANINVGITIGPHSANGSSLARPWAKFGAGKHFYKSINLNQINGHAFEAGESGTSSNPTHRLGNTKNTTLLPVKLRFNPGITPKRIIVRVGGKDVFDSGMVSNIWNDQQISILTSFNKNFAADATFKVDLAVTREQSNEDQLKELQSYTRTPISRRLLELLEARFKPVVFSRNSIRDFVSIPSTTMRIFHSQVAALTSAQMCLSLGDPSFNFNQNSSSRVKPDANDRAMIVEYFQSACQTIANRELSSYRTLQNDVPKAFFDAVAFNFTSSRTSELSSLMAPYNGAEFNKWIRDTGNFRMYTLMKILYPDKDISQDNGKSPWFISGEYFAGIFLIPAYRGELISNNSPGGIVSIPDIKISSTKDVVDVFVYSISKAADDYTLENVR